MLTLQSSDFRLWSVRLQLNPPNRLVRTRMPGGVSMGRERPANSNENRHERPYDDR